MKEFLRFICTNRLNRLIIETHSLSFQTYLLFIFFVLVSAPLNASEPIPYHTNRVFKAVTYRDSSLYQLLIAASQLTNVVGPTNITIVTNLTRAVEYESVAFGYNTPESAWCGIRSNYLQITSIHTNKIYDNVGWVRGTHQAEGKWGAYLWLIQNQIVFTSSVSSVWVSPFGVTNIIEQVMVGTLGDYAPKQRVTSIGPTNLTAGLDYTNFPGVETGEDVTFTLDLTTYYKIRLKPVIELVPDFNHDRVITEQDYADLIQDGPFRFWINDDSDNGDVSDGSSDVPGSGTPNSADSVVNGRSDLLDFFPVWLNLQYALKDYPTSSGAVYRLRHDGNALKFVYTDLRNSQAGSYLTTDGSTYGSSFIQNSYEAGTAPISSSGVNLSTAFLDKIKTDSSKGVLLIEGSAETTEPLILELWQGGLKITELKIPLSIKGVEQEYRWVNLRNMTNPGTLDAPNNYPDSLCNSKNFIFVHGYSVDEQSARGWNAEVFKRMYWSGSRARFHAVTWFGNDSQMNIPLLGSLTPDYHVNVIHAFQTAPALAAYVNGLSGEHIVAAHSLGNMVASAAIQDYGMNAAKYYMVDAAVALEAYDGDPSARSLDMAHADWDGYPERLYCGNWHTNFPSGDQRRELTWADRFENAVDHAYNFYSSGEETLSTHAHNDAPGLLDVGIFSEVHEYAWALQEKLKGRMWVSWMGGGSTYGGWGFNPAYNTGVYDRSNDVYLIATTPEAAATIPNYILPENPYFRPGSGDIDDLYSTNAATGSAFAQSNQADLLAAFIPALSLPAGANEVAKIEDIGGGNFNMQAVGAYPGFQNDWPDVRKNNNSYGTRWLHSDFKNISFPYVHSLFEKFTDEGGLDAQ